MTTKTYLRAGFHLGVGGNQTGIGDLYCKKLAACQIPFVIMSADNFPEEAQQLAVQNPDLRHFVGYRRCTAKKEAPAKVPPSGDPNVPRYGIPAQQASDEHWAWHTSPHILPPEYDGRFTYLLTINEPNKDTDAYVEWLADVEYYNCLKALAVGFRYAVFAWAGGNPEPRHWVGSQMNRLLDLIEQHPGKLAVAVHEYSWVTNNIWNTRDGDVFHLVGRAHSLLLKNRPSLPLVITEFGWAERDAPPDINRAICEIREVGELYARYPNYLGAAIWYLGPGFGNIDNTVNQYIAPLADHIIANPFEVNPVKQSPDTWEQQAWAISVSEQIARGIPLNPNAALQVAIYRDGLVPVHREIVVEGITIQAGESLKGDAPRRVYYASQTGQSVRSFTNPTEISQLPIADIKLKYRPCDTDRVTQKFGENPNDYKEFGLPAHEGIDYDVAPGLPFYAAAEGCVVHASDRKWDDNKPSNYGWHVVIDHGNYCTVYAHARPTLPVQVGQDVPAGQIVGHSGNTGRSSGPHLHFGLLDKTGKIPPDIPDIIYPLWFYGRPVNPAPFLVGLLPPESREIVAVLPFLRGQDRVQFDLDYGAGTQTTQVRHLPDDRWLYVKGEPGQYECLVVRTHNGAPWIFRAEDTSESRCHMYAHYQSQGGAIGAPWVPVSMEVGKWYVTTKFVQHYDKELINDCWTGACIPTNNNGTVTDKIRLLSRPYNRTYPSGKKLRIITLEWSSGEQYDFCETFGNVGFRDATRNFWFMDGPLNGRPDKTYIKPGINVGW